MSETTQSQQVDFTVDKTNLYREESITDLKVASIRRMVPVLPDGSEDTSRTAIFIGQTQLMSPEGPLPIQANLEAADLEDAIAKFPDAMQKSLNEVIEQVRQYQARQQQQGRTVATPRDTDSRIIVPGR
jgi:hypothetical protein